MPDCHLNDCMSPSRSHAIDVSGRLHLFSYVIKVCGELQIICLAMGQLFLAACREFG